MKIAKNQPKIKILGTFLWISYKVYCSILVQVWGAKWDMAPIKCYPKASPSILEFFKSQEHNEKIRNAQAGGDIFVQSAKNVSKI